MKEIPGIGKSYTAKEFAEGIKNGTIDVKKLQEQGNRIAQMYHQDPDAFARNARAPIPELSPAEKQQLEAALARLKKMVK